ncbi:MAG: superoxide dismutase family protein [Hyphomicrobiaceae bacterium]
MKSYAISAGLSLTFAVVTTVATTFTTQPIVAQSRPEAIPVQAPRARSNEQQIRQRINTGVTKLITGGIEYASNTYGKLAGDLAAILDEQARLRILPIMGYGAVRNIEDMLYLRGIDIGMMHSDVLTHLELEGKYPEARRRLKLLAKLYDEPFHVIARKEYTTVGELTGKPVAIGPPNSGADMSVRTLIRLLRIKPRMINLTWSEAVAQLRAGQLAAMIYPTRRPSTFVRSLNRDNNLHILEMTETPRTAGTYDELTLKSEDYPNLLAEGETRTTLSLSAILAVFNWSPRGIRYPQVRRFIERLFEKRQELTGPNRHVVWKTFDLASNVKGWQRYSVVQELLDKQPKAPQVLASITRDASVTPMSQIKSQFDKFLEQFPGSIAPNGGSAQVARIYNEFLSWPQNPIEIKVPIRLTTASGVGRAIGIITVRNMEINVAGRKEYGLLIKPTLAGLKPGKYAFHVHEKPACGPAAQNGQQVPGLAAGGHLFVDVAGQDATLRSRVHLGDLPDIAVNAQGKSTGPIIAPRLTLADVASRALVIHASNDDASPRMACGALN